MLFWRDHLIQQICVLPLKNVNHTLSHFCCPIAPHCVWDFFSWRTWHLSTSSVLIPSFLLIYFTYGKHCLTLGIYWSYSPGCSIEPAPLSLLIFLSTTARTPVAMPYLKKDPPPQRLCYQQAQFFALQC